MRRGKDSSGTGGCLGYPRVMETIEGKCVLDMLIAVGQRVDDKQDLSMPHIYIHIYSRCHDRRLSTADALRVDREVESWSAP